MNKKYAIVGGKLVDGTGAEPVENSLVLVEEDGKISYAGPHEDVPADKGYEVIDAAGKTVMPGLIDTHLHFSGNLTDDDTDWVMQPLLEKQAVAVKQAYDCLTHGLTTVCEIGRFGIHVRDCINNGVFPGLRAGIVAPLKVRDRCMGTLGLFYPRASAIDMRQTALATGFAELLSTQLASFELERQDELTARMELQALQSQVDPHFLFNTIGTIASLVRTSPERARSLLIDFSNYYRQTLSNSEELTTLSSELDQGVRYINLMQARFGTDRLRVKAEIDPDVLDCRVPPFILQPLLENCTKHAMRETGPLTICVQGHRQGDRVEVVVEDDGVGMDEATLAHLFEARDAALEGSDDIAADGSTPRGCGLALVNVLMRIRFFFGEDSGIHVESQLGVGTRATVSLVGEPRELASVRPVARG